MCTENTIYLGLGGNLNNPARNVLKAIDKIASLKQIEAFRSSNLYETEPFKCSADQPKYINAVVSFTTKMSLEELAYNLFLIETKLGKTEKPKTAPRSIDIDILLYGDSIIEINGITVPHPRLLERLFVLVPLRELTPVICYRKESIVLDDLIESFLEKDTWISPHGSKNK